ncbi:MAG: rod shape-determining protein MreC [Treponema sp.]|jgi:rod shape-determining protein MreC|nr:rod shape-determining protein MreC [Treponema sp.]
MNKKTLKAEGAIFGLLFFVSFLFLFFSTRSFATGFKNFGLSFFFGVRNGVHEITRTVSDTILAIKELAILREEYAELTVRIARYEELERNASEILSENRRLREQLDFAHAAAYKNIPAEITGKDPDNLFSALVINKGAHNGVSENMPVIAFQNGTQSLVGKVIKAGLFESMVMPLFDASSFVAARFAYSRYEGIVGGQGRQDKPLVMRFSQKHAGNEINFGDEVISSGVGGVYPPNINIGRVSKILYQESEISMEVELESSVDFSRLEYVFVVNSGKKEGVGSLE